MSKKGGSQFFTISTVVIILIAVYFTLKVQLPENDLNEHFEISNLTTTFGKKDFKSALLFDPDGRGTKISYDVPYIHINAQITNLTGDDIEVAKIFPELNVEFKYGQKIFTLMDFRVKYGVWKSNQILTIDEDFKMMTNNPEGDLDNEFMNHHPEKLDLKLSIHATNSVGMNLNELIFSEEINSWNVN